jgi:hypothetical protein
MRRPAISPAGSDERAQGGERDKKSANDRPSARKISPPLQGPRSVGVDRGRRRSVAFGPHRKRHDAFLNVEVPEPCCVQENILGIEKHEEVV